MFRELVFVFSVASFIVRLFSVLLFRFVLFDYSVFDYLIIPEYFSVLIRELYSRYFNPHNNNHPAVNKHSTADSTIFILVKEARAYYYHRHSGISEPISPYRLSRRRDTSPPDH
jgi:hypothetical protein